MSDYASGSVYLTLRLLDTRTGWKLSPVKATSRPPSVVDNDCVVVHFRAQVPVAAWMPLKADALVVGEDAVETRAEVSP